MWNQHGGDMSKAMSPIPADTGKDGGYSTPDVYGRAAQFYLSLQSSAAQALFNSEDVLLWRGLVTMLALRNVLNLPLQWEPVNFFSSDLLTNALAHPPDEQRQLLYPDERLYQWDGKSFYVLTWAPNGIRQCDLAVYSPMTLLYPVADWRRNFFAVSEEVQVLHKFFDRAKDVQKSRSIVQGVQNTRNVMASTFRNCLDSLQDGERKLVYLWLKGMRNDLYGLQVNGAKNNGRASYHGTNSDAKTILCQHIDRYINDLMSRDGNLNGDSAENLKWQTFPEYAAAKYAGLPRPLISAYDIPGGPIFADQICYFQVDHNSDNPFEPCNCSQNYKIDGQLDAELDLYAFLPIHPERQATCLESGLAQSVHMEIIPDPNGDNSKSYIRVSAKLDVLGDFPLEHDYLISDDLTDKPDTAICYKYSDGENAVLDSSNWPLIAVWPDVIGTGWNEYYVMRSERASKCLQLYDEKLWESNPNASATKGSNSAVVKTTYVPDAIPFVREISPGKKVSVGMVTPQIPLRQGGSTVATVAVDFGTTSTRVFYKMDSTGKIGEIIPSEQDKPLLVTKLYDDNKAKYEEMGQSFISPSPPLIQGAFLLSIFRRSEYVNKEKVPPLLEGVIYHPDKYTDLDKEDSRYLVTDLKWNGDTAAPYYMAFMQQLCIHIMSVLYRERGVNVLKWIYALPKAMEVERGGTDRVRKIWKDLGDFLKRTGGNIESSILKPLTESVAASRFFAVNHSGEINKKKGYLVVDIGGGTTDVALWWSRDGRGPATLQWHASVRVAGRKMFTAWVERYLEEINVTASDPELQKLINNILNPVTPLSAEAKTALVDRLLSSYSDKLKDDYDKEWEKENDNWAIKLCRRFTQAVTLLMFCLGYQVGALMKAKQGDDKENGEPLFGIKPKKYEPGYFSIAIAGRGSLMWDWLKDCSDRQLCDFFKAGVAAAGSTWPDVDIRIVRDDDPKATVGQGLLESPANLDLSEGWGDLPNMERLNQELEESSYYHEATKSFLKCYGDTLRDPTLKELDENTLAGYAQHSKATLNNTFKILMEAVYTYLESQS